MDLKFNNLRDAISRYSLEKATIPTILGMIIQDPAKKDLVEFLEKYIEEKQLEIHDVCSSHKDELLNSLDLVNQMRDSFKTAREDVSYLQSGIQEVGNFLIQTYSKIDQPKKQLEEMQMASEYLEEINSAVLLLNKAQAQILGLRHISALRTLGKVKSLKFLKEYTTDTSRIILNIIPSMEKQVEDKIEESLSDWLVKTRKKAESSGKQLFSQIENRLAIDKQKKYTENTKGFKLRDSAIMAIQTMKTFTPSIKPSRELNSYRLIKLASMLQSSRISQPKVNQNTEATVISIDFSALIQFESVFEALGKGKYFREKLKYIRKSQILQTTSFYQTQREKLEALAGQLIIEKELCEHDDRLRSEEELQGIWIETVTLLERILQELISSTYEASAILEIKKSTVLFVNSTLKSKFTHRSYELYQLLDKNHKIYRESLLSNFKIEAVKIIEAETYSFIKDGEVETSVLEDVGLPIQSSQGNYSFSLSVPRLAQIVKKYVWMDLAYLEYVFERTGEELFKTIDELMQSVNKLLFHQINQSTVLQTAIVAINTNFLYKTFTHIYEFFEEVTGANRVVSAREVFIELKDKCESSIFLKMQESIATYINLLKDFNPTAVEAHSWIRDMLGYINNTAGSLENLLGVQLSSTALFASFQFFSNEFIAILKKTDQKFNIFFILGLEKDLNLINLFMQESIYCRKVPGLNDALGELRELVNLFVNNDFDNLKDQNFRESRYPRLEVKGLATILEKFKETKGKDPKQKNVLSIAKKLKELI
jgi:exocyst complex component 6